MGRPAIDRTGHKYGKLTAIKRVGSNPSKSPLWFCHCDCGGEATVSSGNLHSGQTKSCGCLVGGTTTHGMSRTLIYKTWINMINRCHKTEARDYINYGARGIYVCDDWRKSFASFYESMGPRPSPKHSLERIDNNGPYDPSNVVWATSREQNRNYSLNHNITINGETMCVTDWAERMGMYKHTLYQRLRNGWDAHAAVITPVHSKRPSCREQAE